MWPKFLTPKKMRDDYVLAVFLDQNNREKPRLAQVNDGAIVINETRYIVDHRLATETGMFRTPTFYYVEGNSGPIDLRGNITIQLDAHEEFLKMESHVASDALEGLGDGGLFENRQFMLLLIIVVGAVGFLWWNFNGKFETQAEQLTRIEQQRSPSISQTPIVPFNP